MNVRAATPGDVCHVIRHLRERNRRELLATRFHSELQFVAEEILSFERFCVRLEALCADDGEAVALAGVWLVGPGLASVMLTMTDRWPAIGPRALLYLRDRYMPQWLRTIRRAETMIIDWPGDSRAWLRFLGFHEEGRAVGHGRGGETFIHAAWLNPCWRATVDAPAPPLRYRPSAQRGLAHV